MKIETATPANVEAHKHLRDTLLSGEDWLMARTLAYAKRQDYTRYTSTLEEAWRVSIVGLSASIIEALDTYESIPELNPDDDYEKDPCAAFGILEAQKHRARGIEIDLFVGLLKYYRQSYFDLVGETTPDENTKKWCSLFLERIFDRIEIGLVKEWTHLSRDARTDEMQDANRLLANEKNKYLTLFESLFPPIILIDENGLVDNLNFSAARLFTGSLTPGKLYYDNGARPKGNMPWLAEELTRFGASGESETVFEKSYPLVEETLEFEVKFARMLDVSGKFSGITIILNDITKRKRAEEERARIEAQMLQAQKMKSLGTMAASIAHHFNNILMSLLGNLRLASDGMLEDLRCKPFLDEAEKAAKRAAELSTLMLTYVGQTGTRFHAFDLSLAVQEIEELLFVSVSPKANLTYSLCPDLSKIKGDPSQVRQIIVNLLTNASEALGDHEGNISLKTFSKECDKEFLKETYFYENQSEGPYIVLEVDDTGCGMDEETQRKIFDPFFTTKFTGRGLGLAAVLGIVRGHKGAISVQSQPGVGTKVSVLFPAEQPSS